MDTSTWLTLIALIIGVFGVYVWKQRKDIRDGKALWWATVSEPLYYVSDDPYDVTVTERAANARDLLEAHGNGYLNRENDVWEYVYSATPETPTRDFSQWQDWALLDVIKRREAWRQQKAGYNQRAAQERFGGQTIQTQPSAN